MSSCYRFGPAMLSKSLTPRYERGTPARLIAKPLVIRHFDVNSPYNSPWKALPMARNTRVDHDRIQPYIGLSNPIVVIQQGLQIHLSLVSFMRRPFSAQQSQSLRYTQKRLIRKRRQQPCHSDSCDFSTPLSRGCC